MVIWVQREQGQAGVAADSAEAELQSQAEAPAPVAKVAAAKAVKEAAAEVGAYKLALEASEETRIHLAHLITHKAVATWAITETLNGH